MAQATISVRVDSYDKAAFDSFCSRVGLNTSSVINLFVKKVIAEERIPFEISIARRKKSESVSKLPTLDRLSVEQFDAMMQRGYDDAIAGRGLSLDEAFERIREVI